MSAPSQSPSNEPSVVELIVHGVSGTPPEAVLRCPIEEIDREDGDDPPGSIAGAPKNARKGKRASPKRSRGWAHLGAGRRALWLLFLPFILINLAHWMLPPPKKKLLSALSISVLRLLGLSLTLTILLASVTVGMDMIGWQCAGLAQCSDRLGPAKVLASLPTRGAQLAITALPIAVMVAALWLFGRSQARPDSPRPSGGRRRPRTPCTEQLLGQRQVGRPTSGVSHRRLAFGTGPGDSHCALSLFIGPAATCFRRVVNGECGATSHGGRRDHAEQDHRARGAWPE